MEKMESVEGKIEALSERDGKWGVKLGGTWYNGFGAMPVVYKEAEDKGELVRISFELSKDGKFRNLKNLTKIPILEKKPEAKQETFKNGDRLTAEDRVIGVNARIMSQCYREVEGILNKRPTTDGEIAMVNSLFISATKGLQGYMYAKISEFAKQEEPK